MRLSLQQLFPNPVQRFMKKILANLWCSQKRTQSSVIKCTSKIKKMLLSKGIELNDLIWQSVYKFIGSINKNVGENQAPEFRFSHFR